MSDNALFSPAVTLAGLNNFSTNTLIGHLGIEFVEVGPNFLRARMPVEPRTHQPFGLLHGGASVALAETLGSSASASLLDLGQQAPVGIEINANHLRSVSSGYVYGTVTPLHIGQRTHVWEIRIVDEAERPVCVSRLTVMVVERKT
jgi:1,4-dihydroxy-2-naphthoyl-CoA hydrolase